LCRCRRAGAKLLRYRDTDMEVLDGLCSVGSQVQGSDVIVQVVSGCKGAEEQRRCRSRGAEVQRCRCFAEVV
jgi:hypothetical protein